jgi:hypothetical protein
MKKVAAIFSIILTTLVLFSSPDAVRAQQKAESVVGVVTAIDLNHSNATIKTDSGASLIVKTEDNTACLRVPAGEKSLSNAVPIKFAEIAVGDRILGHGAKTDQGFMAQRLVVMPASEVAKKREHDLDDWKQRGIGGVVRELNPQTGEITLELRGAGAGTSIIVQSSQATLRRYVPGSLSFEDAQPGAIGDVRPGDQLRALGNKGADARTFAAEQIVSGTFRTIGVTVNEVNPQTGSIKATTLDQKKPIEIGFNKDSTLRRISPQVAAAIAQKAKAEAPKSGNTPAGATQAQKPAVVDVQHMIDALPAVPLTDLKTGDVLAVTGAIEKDDSRLVAIKLAAGVDLVLKALAPAPGKTQQIDPQRLCRQPVQSQQSRNADW